MNNNIESNRCECIPRIGWTLLNHVSEFVLLCGFSVGSCCHWCQWFDYLGDCWIICHWCQVIDWLKIDEQCICIVLDETDRSQSGNQFIKMDHWYDAQMKMDQWVVIDTWWCIVCLMKRWLIIVLLWLIRCKNGWTPKWSPYGESPHEKTLCGLSYPRRMVGGPMLICGIMRWRSRKLLVNHPRWIVLVMSFPVVCGMSHSSSRFESYGLMKLEDPHMKAWSPQGQRSQSNLKEEIII